MVMRTEVYSQAQQEFAQRDGHISLSFAELQRGEDKIHPEVRQHTFPSGRRVLTFEAAGQALSWMDFENSSTYIAHTRFSGRLVASQWFQFRFPNVKPNPTEDFYMFVDKTGEPRVVDPTVETMDPNSDRFARYELLETTGSPQETDVLRAQKAAVKADILPLIEEGLDAYRQGETSAATVLGETKAGSVYMYEVTKEVEERSMIKGDSESQSEQFNPDSKRNRNNPNGVQLLKEGDLLILIFVLNEKGKPSFMSPRWGRAKNVVDYPVWSVGNPSAKVRDDIVAATEPIDPRFRSRVGTKILKHLAGKLVEDSDFVYPKQEVDFPEDPQAGIEAQIDRVTRCEEKTHTMSAYLRNTWAAGEISRMADVLREKYGDDPRKIAKEQFDLAEPVVEKAVGMETDAAMHYLATAKYVGDFKRTMSELFRYATLRSMGLTGNSDELNHNYARFDAFMSQLAASDPTVLETLHNMGDASKAELTDEERNRLAGEIEGRQKAERIRKQTATIQSTLDPLVGPENRIQAIMGHNFANMRELQPGDTFVLAAQFCPLYVDDPRPLNEYAQLMDSLTGEEQDILNSAVGPKWTATKAVVGKLGETLRQMGVRLKVHASFGDVGAIVTKREWADPKLLEEQAELYKKYFTQFCEKAGVELQYDRLSDHSQDKLPTNNRVPQYVVVNEGQIIEGKPSVEEVLRLFGLEKKIQLNSKDGRDRANVFARRLEMSRGNVDLARYLSHTYVSILPLVTEGADAQLGMELADIYLALFSAIPNSKQAKMPKINVLAE